MKKLTLALFAAAFLTSASVSAQSNPCNPCGPTADMGSAIAVNPCYAMAGNVFYVDDPAQRNWVTFKSSAPLEDIVGTSNSITGYLVFDPKQPKKGGRGELRIPIASLTTGIPLRDEHLQSPDWLNAGEHPNITLTILDVNNVKKVKSTADYQTYDVKLTGEFTLNGKTRKVKIPGRLTYLRETAKTRQKMEGNLLAARAAFDIRLADYGITGPHGAGLIGEKVGETVAVEVSFMGTSNAPGMVAENPDNPCGGAMNACNPDRGKKAINPCNPCGM